MLNSFVAVIHPEKFEYYPISISLLDFLLQPIECLVVSFVICFPFLFDLRYLSSL